ncbi:MAG: dynamin family protein, partial [Hornefia butyriciproducens]|nr:dynamin family protein [Hornefia butyriciproducens]
MLEKPIREMTTREKAARAYRLLSEDEAVRGQARAARTLLEKLEDQDMTVAVVGQFKRGKSALSNRILGEDVLPVGIVPITSAVTRVKYGERRAEVRYENGICEEIPESDLHRFISEQENRNNELGVAEVVLQAPSGFLKSGLTFVDTPGVGSFHKNNTEVAYDHMKESDAVIFLLSVDSPINQIEIDFLRNTRNFAARFYFAVNKIDTVSPAELGEYLKYCESVLEQLMGEKEIRIFPVSARTGEGVEELKAVIQADLGAQARSIMEMSTAKKLIDVIDRAVEQLDFYWKAMNMEYKELDRRFEEIEKTMTDIRAR